MKKSKSQKRKEALLNKIDNQKSTIDSTINNESNFNPKLNQSKYNKSSSNNTVKNKTKILPEQLVISKEDIDNSKNIADNINTPGKNLLTSERNQKNVTENEYQITDNPLLHSKNQNQIKLLNNNTNNGISITLQPPLQDQENSESKNSNPNNDQNSEYGYQMQQQKGEKQPNYFCNSIVKFRKRVWKIIRINQLMGKTGFNREQFNLINDLAGGSYTENDLDESKKSLEEIILLSMKGFCEFLDKGIGVFNPSSYISLIWDVWQFSFNIYVVFITSVYIFFDLSKDPVWHTQSFEWQILIQLFVDIIKGFSTGHVQQGVIILDHFSVAKEYFSNMFLFDLLALIPSSLTLYTSKNFQIEYYYVFFVLKMFIFFKLNAIYIRLNRFKGQLLLNDSKKLLLQLLELAVSILLLSHIFSILYHSIAMYQYKILDLDDTWLHNAEILHENYWRKYVESIFVACSSMITVLVYVPQNEIEIIFVTFTMIFNCGVFAYSINTLGNILDAMKKLNKKYENEMTVLNRYFLIKQIPKELQIKMKDYLTYLHKEKGHLELQEIEKVLKKFSVTLRDEMQKTVYKQKIDQFQVLKDNFHKQTLKDLYKYVAEVMLGPDENIFEQDTNDDKPNDRSIYLIEKGEVDIYIQNGDGTISLIKTLQQGQCFGEIGFFTGLQRTALAKSRGFSQLLKIPRQEFIELVKEQGIDDDYEKFCFLRDTFMYSQNYRIVDIHCHTCKNFGHLSKDCSKTHYVVTQRNFFKKNKEELAKFNTSFVRKTRKVEGYSSLNHIWEIQEFALSFFETYEEEIEQYEQEYLEISDELDYSDESDHQIQEEQENSQGEGDHQAQDLDQTPNQQQKKDQSLTKKTSIDSVPQVTSEKDIFHLNERSPSETIRQKQKSQFQRKESAYTGLKNLFNKNDPNKTQKIDKKKSKNTIIKRQQTQNLKNSVTGENFQSIKNFNTSQENLSNNKQYQSNSPSLNNLQVQPSLQNIDPSPTNMNSLIHQISISNQKNNMSASNQQMGHHINSIKQILLAKQMSSQKKKEIQNQLQILQNHALYQSQSSHNYNQQFSKKYSQMNLNIPQKSHNQLSPQQLTPQASSNVQTKRDMYDNQQMQQISPDKLIRQSIRQILEEQHLKIENKQLEKKILDIDEKNYNQYDEYVVNDTQTKINFYLDMLKEYKVYYPTSNLSFILPKINPKNDFKKIKRNNKRQYSFIITDKQKNNRNSFAKDQNNSDTTSKYFSPLIQQIQKNSNKSQQKGLESSFFNKNSKRLEERRAQQKKLTNINDLEKNIEEDNNIKQGFLKQIVDHQQKDQISKNNQNNPLKNYQNTNYIESEQQQLTRDNPELDICIKSPKSPTHLFLNQNQKDNQEGNMTFSVNNLDKNLNKRKTSLDDFSSDTSAEEQLQDM